MEKQLIDLDKIVQAIHKREPHLKVYECYDLAIKILNVSELNNISTHLKHLKNLTIENQKI